MRTFHLAAISLAAVTAATVVAARPASACTVTREPEAAVLGDHRATGDRPLIALARVPASAPLALVGPHGDVALERHADLVRPRVALEAGAEYRVSLRGGGRDRVLARLTVAAQPTDAVPAWAGAELVTAGVLPPRTTCEGDAWALTVRLRTDADHPRPTGFLYVYDRAPRAATPLAGLRGVVPISDGDLRLGRVGLGVSFEPRWDRARRPRKVWLALGDAAGHVGSPVALAVPRARR